MDFVCAKCGETKPAEQFHVRQRDGRSLTCRSCVGARRSELRRRRIIQGVLDNPPPPPAPREALCETCGLTLRDTYSLAIHRGKVHKVPRTPKAKREPRPVRPEPSETELLTRYGGLLWDAMCAFSMDPGHLTDMCEAAALIIYKRAVWAVRSEAVKLAKPGENVKEMMRSMMAERGIFPPVTGKRRHTKQEPVSDE
jgi:hypothetical protein